MHASCEYISIVSIGRDDDDARTLFFPVSLLKPCAYNIIMNLSHKIVMNAAEEEKYLYHYRYILLLKL